MYGPDLNWTFRLVSFVNDVTSPTRLASICSVGVKPVAYAIDAATSYKFWMSLFCTTFWFTPPIATPNSPALDLLQKSFELLSLPPLPNLSLRLADTGKSFALISWAISLI